MGLVAKQGVNHSFEPAPAGTHLARCVRLIDLGTQHNEKFGNTKHQVLVFWELPTELDGEAPFIVWRRYTCSIHDKAILGKHLASWRGRPFDPLELEGFELKNIVGKPCMITVVHNTKETTSGKTTYANVNSVSGGGQAASARRSRTVKPNHLTNSSTMWSPRTGSTRTAGMPCNRQ
jgi:hypothetical protein